MGKNIYKKIIVFSVAMVFLGLILVPTMGAVNQKIGKNLTDSYKNSTTSNCQIFDLLIITPAQFEKELESFVEHKRNVGISTIITTLDDVYDEMYWHGRDEPEKIKYFIKSAIEEWGTKYVLLVGGKKGQLPLWHFPVRYVSMDNGWEPHFISDLYYADIYDENDDFSSWDSDGDGHYGEWYCGAEPGDINIDLSPDVAVGRLRVETNWK